MTGFILAAGKGTRLQPLTDTVPKALVDVGGLPLLRHTADRLVGAGCDRLVVNTAYLAEQIERYVGQQGGNLGVETVLSFEPGGPYETGGGLLHARDLLPDAPVLIHNVDILSEIDLPALYAAHDDTCLATLAVREAETDRYLLFDDAGLLGYAHEGNERQVREPEGTVHRYDFCGIQVVSSDLAGRFEETGTFSIMTPYLRLAKQKAGIRAYHVGAAYWLDVGTHERLAEAERYVRERAG
jgi:NDP-sugar pyrophosphorylase family protein